MIRARHVAGVELEGLLDAGARPWRSAPATELRLVGTPLGMQPTGAIRAKWSGRSIGAVKGVRVSALHTGRLLAFRLQWRDPSEDASVVENTAFPDAAALLMPSVPDAPLFTMGAPGKAVTAWYWRADENGTGRHVVAEGIGTSRTVDTELVRGRGAWKDGVWRVVIARPLQVQGDAPVTQLRPGESLRVGVAVWEGSHGERGGIKAFSPDWPELRLEETRREASARSARR